MAEFSVWLYNIVKINYMEAMMALHKLVRVTIEVEALLATDTTDDFPQLTDKIRIVVKGA